MDKAYHSGDSEADNSRTQKWIIKQIQEVANVDIMHDVCATKESKVHDSFWSKKDDALTQRWEDIYIDNIWDAKDALWMNPPFSLAKQFTTKAAEEAQNGVVTIGCVKHAPDTDWFIEMEKRATFIYVPDGRIQFLKADGSPFTRIDKKTGKRVKSGANFPLCFPLWTPFNNGGQAKHVRFVRDEKRYT